MALGQRSRVLISVLWQWACHHIWADETPTWSLLPGQWRSFWVDRTGHGPWLGGFEIKPQGPFQFLQPRLRSVDLALEAQKYVSHQSPSRLHCSLTTARGVAIDCRALSRSSEVQMSFLPGTCASRTSCGMWLGGAGTKNRAFQDYLGLKTGVVPTGTPESQNCWQTNRLWLYKKWNCRALSGSGGADSSFSCLVPMPVVLLMNCGHA